MGLEVLSKVLPTSSEPSLVTNNPSIYLPVRYHLWNTQLAFFLKDASHSPEHNSSNPHLHSQHFVVFQTKEQPIVNASFGPFTAEATLPKELLQPSSTLDIPDRLTVNWKVRAFIIHQRISSLQPLVQVLFYIAGRDWDDFGVLDELPCIRLHAFRDIREIKSACRLRGSLAMCLIQVELPLGWFSSPAAPLGRRKILDNLDVMTENFQVELYYTLQPPSPNGECVEDFSARRGGASVRGEGPTQHPLLRIGSVTLYHPSPTQLMQEHRLDRSLFIRLQDKPLKPGEILTVFLYLLPNSSVDAFTLRVKAKKGVNLIKAKSENPDWWVKHEDSTGGKHSTATIEVRKVPMSPIRNDLPPLEIMQLEFEMENFTSQSVTRRIMWHVDYQERHFTPDSEKVMTELTVIQRDIRAIVPLSMDTEIINAAILTGKTVAIPVKVIAVELSGATVDVSSLIECRSTNEDIIKVSKGCDYVFVSGKESRGSVNARVVFSYENLSAPLELTVWIPKLPLHIELSDNRLSQVKGWRIPILPDRRSTRDSDDEEEEEERRVSRGCSLQFQHATVKVFTQFHTTSSEGTDQMVTMLGPDWLVDVTDMVSDFVKVEDTRVAELKRGNIIVGWEPGVTTVKVDSPLMEAVLGETTLTVGDDKVTILDAKIQVVSGLSLSLQPSPGSSHTLIAKAAAQQTLSLLNQQAVLSVWLYFSDNTASSLTIYDPKDYNMAITILNGQAISVMQDNSYTHTPALVAEKEGFDDIKVEMMICELCQKTKRKSVVFTAHTRVRVHFGQEEDSTEESITEDYQGNSSPDGDTDISTGRRQEKSTKGVSTTAKSTTEGKVILGTGENKDTVVPSVEHTTDDLGNFPATTNTEEDGDFAQAHRGLTDLEIGMYALLGVFCLAILVFLINCIVFVLKYRHKRIPPEGQANMEHSHHWVFLGNGQPLRTQNDISPQVESPGNPLETVQCCHGDHHSSGSSQTSVQSQVHGRGDGSSGGSTREHSEDPLNSPTSKRKRVKFTTFTTLPSEELAYNSIPIADEEDIEWVCQDMGLQDPDELHNYIRRVKEIA
ncbi:transmembrane protein 132E [Protopterus annectens]|uniref:transmembrane protein 132E n=1 Tax=Protopterus annectens TaxID=7888 RepID=UPI001CF994AA|nr:transmembrane protein 132E [Protopterus annectens]